MKEILIGLNLAGCFILLSLGQFWLALEPLIAIALFFILTKGDGLLLDIILKLQRWLKK